MGAAYAPGLKVSERVLIRKERRLPLRGEIMVKVGDKVTSQQVVARTDLPGKVYAVNAAGQLNVLEAEVPRLMKKKAADAVSKGEVIAETEGFFGYFKSHLASPVTGTIDTISDKTGRVMLREAPTPVEVRAYIDGRVVDLHEGEGCTVETVGVMCQGIFGLGGETEGPVKTVGSPDRELDAKLFDASCKGKVVVGGKLLTLEAYQAASAAGAVAIVTGGIHYKDIKTILGYEVGVAITGTEKLSTTIVVTEGFGAIEMARATWELIGRQEGKKASANGATQIRAGVIRPELIVSTDTPADDQKEAEPPMLEIGSPIRIIRAPYFGLLGAVTELPVELRAMESETMVRVLCAKLGDGRTVTVPRANVEIIEKK